MARLKTIAEEQLWNLPYLQRYNQRILTIDPYYQTQAWMFRGAKKNVQHGMAGAMRWLDKGVFNDAIPNEVVNGVEYGGLAVSLLMDTMEWGGGEIGYWTAYGLGSLLSPVIGEGGRRMLAEGGGLAGWFGANLVQTVIFSGGNLIPKGATALRTAGSLAVSFGPDMFCMTVGGIVGHEMSSEFNKEGFKFRYEGYDDTFGGVNWTNYKNWQMMKDTPFSTLKKFQDGGVGRVSFDKWTAETLHGQPMFLKASVVGNRIIDHILIDQGETDSDLQPTAKWGKIEVVFTDGSKIDIGEWERGDKPDDLKVKFNPNVIPNQLIDGMKQAGYTFIGNPETKYLYKTIKYSTYKQWYIESNPYAMPPRQRDIFLRKRYEAMRPLSIMTQRRQFQVARMPVTTRMAQTPRGRGVVARPSPPPKATPPVAPRRPPPQRMGRNRRRKSRR